MLPLVPQESSKDSLDIMPMLMDFSDDEEAETVGRPERVYKSQVATMQAFLDSLFLRVCKSQSLAEKMQQVFASFFMAFCNLKGKLSAGCMLPES